MRFPQAMTLQGLWVHFAIRDVIFPTSDAVLRELHGDDVIGGRVLDVSGSDANEDVFVVVNVEGVEQPVVVPVASLRNSPEG